MKKLTLLFSFLSVSTLMWAQVFTSGFENWSDPNTPDGWIGNVVTSTATSIPVTDVVQSSDANSGSLSCQLINTSTSTHRRFTTDPVDVEQGTQYTITFWAKGAGEVRTGLVTVSGGGGPAYGAYNAYIVLTNTWTQYSQVVTGNNTSQGEFIFSVKSSVAPDHILLDDVTITTGGSGTIDYVSIYDIQFTTALDGNSPELGNTVETSGVVTATYADGYFIQDGSGAWRGIHVFDNNNTPNIGDSISITGNVVEFFGLTQISGVAVFDSHGGGYDLPAPAVISSLELSEEEMYEGVLVTVENVECTVQNAGFGMWEINDGSGPAKVHGLIYSYSPVLGAEYTITGVVNYGFDEFRICPRDVDDIIVGNSNVTEVTINQIQFTADVSGDSPYAGQTVATSGIVTAIWPGEGFFIQDGTGPWNGIFVFNTSINPAMGDEISLTANVVEFFGLTQLSSVSSHTIVSSGNTLPAPAVITTAQANTEAYESTFVRVEGAMCTNTDAGFGMFRLNNSTADMLVDDDIFNYDPVLGNAYNAQGVMWYSFAEYKMLVRMATDVEVTGFASLDENLTNEPNVYPNPAFEIASIQNYTGVAVILDAQGRQVLSQNIDNQNNAINLSNLASGIYFLNIGTETIRLVKK